MNTLASIQAKLKSRTKTEKHIDFPIATSDAVSVKVVFATRGLLAMDHVILNHGQVTWTTLEQAPPLLTTSTHGREGVSAVHGFNVHRCPTRRVFSGTGLELMTFLL
ncbi:uncharacterized protein TNCV_698941 [Trichonephila clavipes]|nr:uncharacterized protein TNCV_698941 [Trichonephila clavipes]